MKHIRGLTYVIEHERKRKEELTKECELLKLRLNSSPNQSVKLLLEDNLEMIKGKVKMQSNAIQYLIELLNNYSDEEESQHYVSN